jgi:hypothetical protein
LEDIASIDVTSSSSKLSLVQLISLIKAGHSEARTKNNEEADPSRTGMVKCRCASTAHVLLPHPMPPAGGGLAIECNTAVARTTMERKTLW